MLKTAEKTIFLKILTLTTIYFLILHLNFFFTKVAVVCHTNNRQEILTIEAENLAVRHNLLQKAVHEQVGGFSAYTEKGEPPKDSPESDFKPLPSFLSGSQQQSFRETLPIRPLKSVCSFEPFR